jgi:hypothetical protein
MSRRRHQGAGPSFETQLSHFRNLVLVGRLGHNRIMKGGLQPQHISAMLRSAKGSRH